MKKFLSLILIFNFIIFNSFLPVFADEDLIDNNITILTLNNSSIVQPVLDSSNFHFINDSTVNLNNKGLLIVDYTNNNFCFFSFYDFLDTFSIEFNFNDSTQRYDFTFYRSGSPFSSTNKRNYHFATIDYILKDGSFVWQYAGNNQINNFDYILNDYYASNGSIDEIYLFDTLEDFTTSNTFLNGSIYVPPEIEEPTPDLPINNIDFSEVNENLNKIDKDLQYVITFLSLLAVVILIYIIYRFLNIFFPSF